MEAVLAAHAAAVAAEAVHVGEVGVLRAYPPRPRVERVLLIDVVVISFPAGPSAEEEKERFFQTVVRGKGGRGCPSQVSITNKHLRICLEIEGK